MLFNAIYHVGATMLNATPGVLSAMLQLVAREAPPPCDQHLPLKKAL